MQGGGIWDLWFEGSQGRWGSGDLGTGPMGLRTNGPMRDLGQTLDVVRP